MGTPWLWEEFVHGETAEMREFCCILSKSRIFLQILCASTRKFVEKQR